MTSWVEPFKYGTMYSQYSATWIKWHWTWAKTWNKFDSSVKKRKWFSRLWLRIKHVHVMDQNMYHSYNERDNSGLWKFWISMLLGFQRKPLQYWHLRQKISVSILYSSLQKPVGFAIYLSGCECMLEAKTAKLIYILSRSVRFFGSFVCKIFLCLTTMF